MIERCDGEAAMRVAAGIWARATARRDGLAAPVPVEEKLPGIRSRMSQSGRLDLALLGDEPAGFTILVGAELVYLAVDPDAWGAGVGGRLLAHVDELARSAGLSELSLWVIDANARALAVYERAGWLRTDEIKEADGRRERRLVRRSAG